MESSLRDRIAALVAEEPALASELELRAGLIRLLAHAHVSASALLLPGERVRAKLARGVPLLDGEIIPITSTLTALFERLAVAMLVDVQQRDAAQAVLDAVRSHRLHAQHVVGEAIVGHDDHIAALAGAADVDAGLLGTLADLASRPLLADLGRHLAPARSLGRWERGYCPICGGRPLLTELVRPSPQLRCGRCTTAWAWELPWCPECQGGRLSDLSPPTTTSVPGWTTYCCECCQTYLKVAGTARMDSLPELLLDDLATWKLDRAALAAGLGRKAGLGRRLEHGDIAVEDHVDD